MLNIIMIVFGLIVQWLNWVCIKFPLIVLNFWKTIIKKIWNYVPLVAIALVIVILEVVCIFLGQLIIQKDSIDNFNNLAQKIISFQLDTRLFAFGEQLINGFLNFIYDPLYQRF